MFDPSQTPADVRLNYTASIVYNPSAPTAPTDIQNDFSRVADELMVPTIVEPQLVATRSIELGVFFSTFVSSLWYSLESLGLTFTDPIYILSYSLTDKTELHSITLPTLCLKYPLFSLNSQWATILVIPLFTDLKLTLTFLRREKLSI